jgi:hypothetical protein
VRRVPFSCFSRSHSFSTVPRPSGPVFMFCAPILVVDVAKCVGSRFHILHSRTRFRRCRVRWVPFSCFARPHSFSTVPRPSCPDFMFCAPGLIFDGTEGVRSRFHVLCSRTHFRRYRGHPIPFSCFTLPDSLSAVPSSSGLVFMFCASELIFGGTEALTCFLWYRGRRVPFPCFALHDSFSEVPRSSGSVFMFCAPRLVFGGTEGVVSLFHVLRSRTHFRRYRGRRVPFSYFGASCLVLGSTEGVWSRFHILRSLTFFRWYRGRRVPFLCFALPVSLSALPSASGPADMFCAPGLVFGGAECVGSRFQVLRARTHFRQFRWRRVPFSFFALPDSLSAVPSASGPVFMFCVPELIFGGTKGVGSYFHVLRSRNHFRRYRGRPIPFSCFTRSDSISTIPRASHPVFMFFAPRLIFGGTEGVGSHFHVCAP